MKQDKHTQPLPKKAADNDFLGRFREIVSDPINIFINRVPLAGHITDEGVYLHNGNIVPVSGEYAYYGAFSDILVINRGVHEPLEEYVFQELLNILPSTVTMLELGAYWGHYSMWLKKVKPDSIVYLVEPELKNLDVGKNNFKINNLSGNFIHDFVGKGHFTVDSFYKEHKQQPYPNILHADIQGFEVEMLEDATNTLSQGLVDYVFVSTHSQQLHKDIIKQLETYNYRVEVSSDFENETSSFDGLVFASKSSIPRVLNNAKFLSRTDVVSSNAVSLTNYYNSILSKSNSPTPIKY